jgi:hypothetical protein
MQSCFSLQVAHFKEVKAGAGIEPANSGFADRGLTTWLPRQRKDRKLTLSSRMSIAEIGSKLNQAPQLEIRIAGAAEYVWDLGDKVL